MQKCERSPCAVWVKNCELLSVGIIQELNVDEQFPRRERKSEHQRQEASPPSAVGLSGGVTPIDSIVTAATAGSKI